MIELSTIEPKSVEWLWPDRIPMGSLSLIAGETDDASSRTMAKARTIDGLIGAMGDALRAVRSTDVVGWFRQSGCQPRRSSDTPNEKRL